MGSVRQARLQARLQAVHQFLAAGGAERCDLPRLDAAKLAAVRWEEYVTNHCKPRVMATACLTSEGCRHPAWTPGCASRFVEERPLDESDLDAISW